MKDIEEYFSGRSVYGEDMNPEEIATWFAEEEDGYYGLVLTYGQERSKYGYGALNEFHAFRRLADHYDTCLALGCANGDDVAPLCDRVDRFICVEPSRSWWTDHIGQVPASYRMPSATGKIPCADAECDLAVCLGVLHHIPNASVVIGEIARSLKAGGAFVLREPIHTMGDWRNRRPGLTKNERGFPLHWLDATLSDAGFEVVSRRLCMFPPLSRAMRILGNKRTYANMSLVAIDALLSDIFSLNLHYHRRNIVQKFAPSNIYYLMTKT